MSKSKDRPLHEQVRSRVVVNVEEGRGVSSSSVLRNTGDVRCGSQEEVDRFFNVSIGGGQ